MKQVELKSFTVQLALSPGEDDPRDYKTRTMYFRHTPTWEEVREALTMEFMPEDFLTVFDVWAKNTDKSRIDVKVAGIKIGECWTGPSRGVSPSLYELER